MVYDRTQTRPPLLTQSWWLGARLYRTLGRFDAYRGVSSWAEAFHWLSTVHPGAEIGEIQYWGHGRWGNARVDRDVLDITTLSRGHELQSVLQELRGRLAPETLWWFRTCQTIGAEAGHRFAQAWSEHLGAAVAGHTHVIWYWQSGLHRLAPGAAPRWSTSEGLRSGTPQSPEAALWSRPGRPNTITCLGGQVPEFAT